MFAPITTSRLVIRPVVADDAPALWARRNEPEVSRYQEWTVPYPRHQVDELVRAATAGDGPEDDQWWMLTVVERGSGDIVGDVAVRLVDGARTAELGYSLATRYWGRGYATEAVDATVERLFDQWAVHRVSAMIHPDNDASATVLERIGFVFEGRTIGSYWVDGGAGPVADDVLYGLTVDQWRAWRTRPRHAPTDVELTEITPDDAHRVFALRTHKSQEAFVAPMAVSAVDALFPEVIDGAPVAPWLRAITADGEPVGFVMVTRITSHHPDPYLWRLLVDRAHQRRGIGARAVALVEDRCRRWGATALTTSWVEGRGSPRPFYLKLGFAPTGRIVDGETEATMPLT